MKIPANAPASSGLTQLRRLERGEKLTRGEAILAKCCECSGFWIDGRQDCEIVDCALYAYHPYNPNRSKRGAK